MGNKGDAEIADQILNIIARHPSGALLADLVGSLKTPLLKRTLQRRLADLKKAGLIFTRGQGRATRYFVRRAFTSSVTVARDADISLSVRAEQVRQYVTKPLQERKQVAYHRDFLYNYIPNESFYLRPEVRDHLKEIGKQPNGEHPAGSFALKILDRLLIDLSWNSSRLEGNTYSLLETERLIHGGQVAQGKALFETRMILNHKAAIEFLAELGESLNFTAYVILNLHALLAKNLLSDPQASGRLRSIPVGIGKTVYQPPAIPQLIADHFQKILEIANVIEDPFEQSFFVMVHLPYLQPFVDVNKRVSRLACNIPLIKNNLCPISFVDLPKQTYIDGILGVYELNNVDLLTEIYVWAYGHSTARYSETRSYLVEPDLFLERYDLEISRIVREVIDREQTKAQAIKRLGDWAETHIPQADRERFIEMVQTELLALHEGNIAKHKITLEAFQAWQSIWNEKS